MLDDVNVESAKSGRYGMSLSVVNALLESHILDYVIAKFDKISHFDFEIARLRCIASTFVPIRLVEGFCIRHLGNRGIKIIDSPMVL